MSDGSSDRSAWGCLGALLVLTVLIFTGALVVVRGLNSLGRGGGTTLPPPPPPKEFGTASEIGTRGDGPNPGQLYDGAFPSDDQTQERTIGGRPARFSGYTTWVESVRRVPASRYVDGFPGSYLRVHATVFNRDSQPQHVCACDFEVWTEGHGYREADAVRAPVIAPYAEMRSGAKRVGDVYLYVGTVDGPYFVVYDPDAHVESSSSTARGVWLVNAGGSRSRPSAPPSTPG